MLYFLYLCDVMMLQIPDNYEETKHRLICKKKKVEDSTRFLCSHNHMYIYILHK